MEAVTNFILLQKFYWF